MCRKTRFGPGVLILIRLYECLAQTAEGSQLVDSVRSDQSHLTLSSQSRGIWSPLRWLNLCAAGRRVGSYILKYKVSLVFRPQLSPPKSSCLCRHVRFFILFLNTFIGVCLLLHCSESNISSMLSLPSNQTNKLFPIRRPLLEQTY